MTFPKAAKRDLRNDFRIVVVDRLTDRVFPCVLAGNPAISRRSRPEVLRPRLTAGLPLRMELSERDFRRERKVSQGADVRNYRHARRRA
jgi:hypothetical protein